METTASITAVALALAVGACGKGGDDSGGGGGSGGVKTGPGATADTITLGYLPDLSGVFAPNGKSMMEGANLYWDAKNKDGGICGRKVEVTVQDTGYDPQKGGRRLPPDVRRRDRPRAGARLLDHLRAAAFGRAGRHVPQLRGLDVGHPAQRERRDHAAPPTTSRRSTRSTSS